MSKTYLGIDLGTSSVKVLLTEKGRVLERASAFYDEKTAAGWWEGVKKALRKLSGLCRADAVGLSSQVGTYIINQEEILHWNGPEGTQELQDLLQRFPQELFIAETGMAHPSLISYPLPRLLGASISIDPVKGRSRVDQYDHNKKS